jgi:hypothetical protein
LIYADLIGLDQLRALLQLTCSSSLCDLSENAGKVDEGVERDSIGLGGLGIFDGPGEVRDGAIAWPIRVRQENWREKIRAKGFIIINR